MYTFYYAGSNDDQQYHILKDALKVEIETYHRGESVEDHAIYLVPANDDFKETVCQLNQLGTEVIFLVAFGETDKNAVYQMAENVYTLGAIFPPYSLHEVLYKVKHRCEQREVFKQFFNHMEIMGTIVDPERDIIFVNDAFKRETGHGNDIIGQSYSVLKSDKHSLMFYNNINHALDAGQAWHGTINNTRLNGTGYKEDVNIFPMTIGGKTYFGKTGVNTTRLDDLVTESKKDQEMAKAVQRSLLPEDIYDEKLTIKSKYIPLEHVSGDIYNFYRIDDDRYAVFLADVVGHGVSSALLSTSIIAVVNDLVKVDPSPSVLLRSLNNKIMALFQTSDLTQMSYFTVAYALIDTKKNEVTYSTCGHPALYLLGKEPIKMQTKNFVIGMFSNVDYDEEKQNFEDGDTLFLYTDGITEITNDLREGREKFDGVLDDYLGQDLSLIEYFDQALIEPNYHERQDDITIITIDLRGDKA